MVGLLQSSNSDYYANTFAVVTIGFEESVYIVVEGQEVQLCVGVLNKTLSNNETREFMIQTVQLEEYGATQGLCTYVFSSVYHITDCRC